MAVIKQRRQFLPQNIGVIRADTGAGEVARSAANLADAMIETSFDELKKQARERGVEVAQAASAASLRTINPETGEPEAFSIPQNFGRAAQEAYQRVIEDRYVSQTEQDFKTKAAELYLKYQNDPDGVAKFTSNFSDFIDNTSAGAAPRFANIFQNVGSALLASNKLNLQAKQNERAREAEASQLGQDVQNAAKEILSFYKMPDFSTNEDLQNDKNGIYEKLVNNVNDHFAAGIIKEPQRRLYLAQLKGALYQGTVEGMLSYGVSSRVPITVEEVSKIRTVIQTAGAGIENVREDLRPFAEDILDGEDFRDYQDNIDSQLNDFAANLSRQETAQSRREAEQRQQDLISAEINLNENYRKLAEEFGNAIDANNMVNAVGKVNAAFENINKQAENLKNPAQAIAFRSKGQNIVGSIVIDKVNQIADASQMRAFADYIYTNGRVGGDGLTNELKNYANIINKVFGPQLINRTSINARANRYASEKESIVRADAAAKKRQEDFRVLNNGNANPASQPVRQKAQEQYLASESNITGQQLFGDYFLSPEGIQNMSRWGVAIAQTKVLPQELYQGVKNRLLGTGSAEDPSFGAALQAYANFAQLKTADSLQPINLWYKAGFSEQEIGIIEGALATSALMRGGTQANFSNVLQELRSANDNSEDFANKKALILGDKSIQDFILEETDFSRKDKNPAVAQRFYPYVKYMIAANVQKETIAENLRSIYNTAYKDLAGIVIDPVNQHGNKSMHALTGRFEGNMPDVVSMLNTQLENMGITDGAFFLNYDQAVIEQREIEMTGERGLAAAGRERITAEIEAAEAAGEEATLRTGTAAEMIGDKKVLRLHPMPFAGTTEEDIRYQLVYVDDENILRPYLNITSTETGEQIPTFVTFSLDQMQRDLIQLYSEQ